MVYDGTNTPSMTTTKIYLAVVFGLSLMSAQKRPQTHKRIPAYRVKRPRPIPQRGRTRSGTRPQCNASWLLGADRRLLAAIQNAMQQLIKIAIAAFGGLCLWSLTACVPMISHEYDVKGQGERSESGGCSPTTEVRLTTHLTPATAAVFWGSVERLHHSHRILSLSFTFSNDEVVSLNKPEVTIISNAYSTPRSIPITTIRRASMLNSPSCDPPAASVYQQPSEPMHRMPGTLYGDPVIDSVFVIDIAVPDNPAEFTVQLAPVLIDGKPINVPAVTFLRKSSVSLPALM
jgi:hypothetical protein